MILAGVRGENMKMGQSSASLIDVVFLLLIYFMVTASLIKKEGDLSFLIPVRDVGKVPQLPVEAIIEIHPSGTVGLEGMRFAASDRTLKSLVLQVSGLRRIAADQGAPFYVNIAPHPDARHFRVIDVMDACSLAEVEHLGFTKLF